MQEPKSKTRLPDLEALEGLMAEYQAEHQTKVALARALPRIQRGLLKQERRRLARKLGPEHPRVRALQRRLGHTASLAREVERLADLPGIRRCHVAEGRVLIHGHVTDRIGRPLHQAQVSLVGDGCEPAEGKSVRSDARGYYAFDLSPEETAELAEQGARVAVVGHTGTPLVTATAPIDPYETRQLQPLSVSREAVRGRIPRPAPRPRPEPSPGKPGMPERPGRPRRPDQPGMPGKPRTPGQPGTPGKPDQPEEPGEPGKTRPERPRRGDEAKGPRLEEISGIGPIRARKLRRAGIRDVHEFAAAPERKLRAVLGNLDISGLKKQAKVVERGAES